jgi:hypothetical protein
MNTAFLAANLLFSFILLSISRLYVYNHIYAPIGPQYYYPVCQNVRLLLPFPEL